MMFYIVKINSSPSSGAASGHVVMLGFDDGAAIFVVGRVLLCSTIFDFFCLSALSYYII